MFWLSKEARPQGRVFFCKKFFAETFGSVAKCVTFVSVKPTNNTL